METNNETFWRRFYGKESSPLEAIRGFIGSTVTNERYKILQDYASRPKVKERKMNRRLEKGRLTVALGW